jgi:ectoine hydroxylase-related dioxygenase (phytanoyl-CoA dioxygenase family)
MTVIDCRADATWLTQVLEGLRHHGYAIVTNVLDEGFIAETRSAMYRTRDAIVADVGAERLERAKELGVLRLMMKYEPFFYRYLEIPEMLQVVDATVSKTAILHLQNGFVLPSLDPENTPKVFQNQFHMDFPRVLDGYLASINVMFAIDAFTAENGGTLGVAGTHQKVTKPNTAFLEANAFPVECPGGSMFLFDSTLWHAAGRNESGADRLAINHQFTRSWIKQQLDYVRALGAETIEELPDRTQQLLGWYTRLPTSLDEYYQPSEKRLYRSGQG